MEEKKATTEKETIASTAWALYKSRFTDFLPSAFNFWMIALATFALGIFFPFTLIVTIPFALIPFFFAFQMTMVDGHKQGQISSKVFFGYYMSYFREPFAGCYRVLRNVLVAFLYSSLAYFVVAFATYFIMGAVDSTFFSSVEEALRLIQAGDTTGLTSFMNYNNAFSLFILIVTMAEETAFFFAFLHNLAKYTLNPYLRLVVAGAPSRMINAIYVGTMREIRRNYTKDYYSATWWLILLAIAGFALGFYVGYLFIGLIGFTGVVVCGAFGSFVFLALFLPYFINVNSLLAQKYRNSFSDYSVTLAENTLRQLQNAQRLSEEEVKNLQKSIDDAKAKMGDRDDDKDNENSNKKDS